MQSSGPEIIIGVLIFIVFALGIWGGIKLFRWSQKDRAIIAQRNADRKAKANKQL